MVWVAQASSLWQSMTALFPLWKNRHHGPAFRGTSEGGDMIRSFVSCPRKQKKKRVIQEQTKIKEKEDIFIAFLSPASVTPCSMNLPYLYHKISSGL
jgi:hypothetical protein